MRNEYDSLIKQGNTGLNEYDAILDEQVGASKKQLQQSAFVAKGKDPDRQAEVLKLSNSMNLPEDIVERNFDSLKEKRAQSANSYDAIIDSNPQLAKWIEDKSNAVLAKDDIDNLKGLDNRVREYAFSDQLYNSLGSGIAEVSKGLAGVPNLVYDVAALPVNYYYQATGDDKRLRAKDVLGDYSEKYWEKQAQGFRDQAPDMQASITEEIGKGNFQNAGKALALQFVANAPQQALLITSYLSGFGAPGLVFAGGTTAATKNFENQSEDIDPTVGVTNAVANGAIESAFEKLGTFGVLGHWENVITKSFGKEASREVMKDFAKTLGYSFMAEGNEEFLTSAAQDFSDYVSGVNPDALKGIATRALDAGIVGGFSGGVMTGPSAISSGMMRASRARQVRDAKQFYEALGEDSKSTKLKDRLPEKQKELIDQITSGTPIQDVFIPVESLDVYFQSKNESPVSFMAEIEALESYTEAKETGGDVKVPLSQWVEKVVDSEHYQGLAGDIRFSPEALSENELRLVEMQEQEELKLADQKAEEESNGAVKKVSPRNEIKRQIRDQIAQVKSNLEKAGIKPELDDFGIDSASEVMAERILSRAEVLDQDPQELYKQSGNIIRNMIEDPQLGLVEGEQAYNQSGGPTPEDLGYLDDYDGEDLSDAIDDASLRANRQMERLGDVEQTGFDVKLPSDILPESSLKKEAGWLLSVPREEWSTQFKEVYNRDIEIILRLKESGELPPAIEINGYISDGIARAQLAHSLGESIPVATFSDEVSYDQSSVNDSQSQFPMPESVERLQIENTTLPEAKEVAKLSIERLPGKTVVNQHSDIEIRFTKKSVKHSNNKLASPENRIAQLNIEKLIESAIYWQKKEDKSGGNSHVHLFYSTFQWQGKDYYVKITGKEDSGGQIYYDKFALEKTKPTSQGTSDQTETSRVDSDAEGNWYQDQSQAEISIDEFMQDVNNLRLAEPQFQQDKRGRIIVRGLERIIELGPDADVSTLLHESAHSWLEEIAEDYEKLKDLPREAMKPAQIKFLQDAESTLEYLEVKSFSEIETAQHEKWAEGAEKYFMEGKSPNQRLRKAFSRFRLWLTHIYKSIRGLNVELNDEIRGVFDRLISTQEEIDKALSQQNLEPMFDSRNSESFGLTGKAKEQYDQAVSEAKEAVENHLLNKHMIELSREQKRQRQERLDQIKERYEAEANQTRSFRALSILQKGVLPDGSLLPESLEGLKISKESLLQSYDKETLQRLPRPYIYSSKGGLHFGMVAELLGYEDGDQMIQELLNTPKKEDWINQKAQEELSENYPELLENSEQLKTEALEAVHNESIAKVLRMELEHIASNNMSALKNVIKKTVRRVPPEGQTRMRAEEIMASKNFQEVKPHIYLRAERNAARDASELLAKGDLDGAFEAKRRELLNFELYRATLKAQETVTKSKEFFKKFRQSDDKLSKTRDIDIINAGRSVLYMFDLGSFDIAKDHLKSLKAYTPETYEKIQSLVFELSQNARSYKELTYGEYVDLYDSLRAIWDLSKSSKELEVGGQKISIDDAKRQIIEKIQIASEGKVRMGYDKAATTWDKTKVSLLGIKASLRRVESWAEALDPDGVVKDLIYTPVAEATDRLREDKKKYIEKYLEIVKEVESGLDGKKIQSPELGYTFENKAELLGALLHIGNESNKRKLLLGRNWGVVSEDGTLNTRVWDSFIERMHQEGILTKADYDYIQNVWNLLDDLKPMAQRAHKKLYGYFFNEITSNEFETPFGSYKGGYVPAVVDPFVSSDAAIRNEKESLENDNSYMFPTTGRGFTRSRVEYNAPLMLNLKFIPGHIDKVLRFAHLEPTVKQVGRIITAKDFRNAIDVLDPTIASDMLVPWLQRSARQKVESQSEGAGGRATDRFFKELRTRTGFQIMTANVVNTLQQVTGFSLAAVKVKPSHLRNSLWNYTRSPKSMTESVNEKSSFMRQRISTQVMEIQSHIDELMLDPSKYEKARDFARKHGYFMQAGAQNVVDLIVWSGAYDQAIEGGATELEAVRAGDSAVRLTQGSFNAEDISRFETGTPFIRAFTMFYSYFNMQANLLGTEFGNTIRQMGLRKGAGRLAYLYTMGFMIPAVVAELIVQAFSGEGFDADDDDFYLDDFMSVFFGSQLRTGAAFFPLVGPTLMAGLNSFNDKWYDDRISTSPAVAMLESAVSAPNSVYEAIANNGSKKKAAKDLLSALGLMTGLPFAPLGKPAGYLLEMEDGKTRPKNSLDLARGLVSGRNTQN